MEVTTKRIKSMDAIPAGQEFKLYAYHDCPENTLRFRQGGYHVQTMVMFEKGEWYDVKKEKGVMQKECNTSQPDNGGPQNYQYQPPVFEVIQKTVHVFKEWEQGMDVYSEVDGTNGFIAKDKKSEMQWSSRRNLKPTLYCLERCIDPNKLAEEKDREYCLTINSDGNEERRSPIPGNCDSQQGRQCTCPEDSYLRTQNSVGWNGVYFKKSGTVCLDRKNNVPVGQSYRLYDEKGKAIDVESYIRVQVTVPEDNGLLRTVKGQILEASMHDGGMYFDNEWDHDTQKQKYTNEEAEAIFAKYFKTGVTVHETEYGENGPEAGDESFTLSIIPGSMEVTTKRIKSMDAIPAGQEFKLYAYHD